MSSYFYTINYINPNPNYTIINSTILCVPELLFNYYYMLFSYYYSAYHSIFSYYINYYRSTFSYYINLDDHYATISLLNNYLFEVNTYLVIPL